MAKDVNSEKFADIMNKVPDNATISSLAELFKMFGDPTRAKILSILQVRRRYRTNSGCCVPRSLSKGQRKVRKSDILWTTTM